MKSPIEPPTSEAELIWRVVAWHNRHPLARRINESQVRGVGVVAVPFAAQVAGKPAKPLFGGSEFIRPLSPASITRLARRHGSAQRPGNDAWPIREIPVDAQSAGAPAELRFLRTAAIEVGSRRIRVLIGDGRQPRILGPRIWDQQRAVGLLALATGLAIGVSAAGIGWLQPRAAVDVAQVRTIAPTEVRHQPAGLPAPAGPAAPTPDEPAASAAAGQADTADDSIAYADPIDSEGSVPGADDPSSSDTDTAAARSPQTTPPVAKPAVESAVAAMPPAPPESTVYALATVSTGSRLASQLRVDFMNMPTEPAPDRPHAEVLRVGERWRVVIWPFANRAAAESEREALAERGMKTQLIAF